MTSRERVEITLQHREPDMVPVDLWGSASRLNSSLYKKLAAHFGLDWFVSRVLTPFPKLSPKECIGCQKCANVCPAKAITMVDKKPKINRSSCIHCFCCQEFCPKGAMKVGRTIIARIAAKV